jgi:MFS family permease
MRSGIHFVITHPTIIGFMFMTFLMVLLVVPFFSALIPVYSATIYNVGAKGLGLLLSAAGLGSLLGTMILASCGQLKRPGIISFNVLVIIAILMIAVSLNNHYGFALLLTMLISGAMMTFFSVVGATVQSILPEHMRGKVTGIYMMCWGLIPFGAMTSGFIANGIGADLATRIGALLLTVGITISFFIFRNVWNFRMTSSDESIEKNRDTSPNIPDLLEEPSTS